VTGGRRRLAAALVAAALAVTSLACSSDETAAPPIDPAKVDRAVADAFAIELEPDQRAYEIRATFQYDGFLVTVGDGVYDSTDGILRLGLRYENLTGGWSQAPVSAAYTGPGSEDVPLSLFAPLVDVPPRRTVEITAEIESLTEAPDGSSRLAWGRDDRDQPVVAFDGEHEDLWVPADVAVDTWAGIGRHAVHVTSGRVFAADLAHNVQNDPGLRTLRLTFDTYSLVMDPVNGFHPLEHLTLVQPDGEVVEGSGASEGFVPESWTATSDNWIEFPIDASIEGDYELQLTSQSPSALGSLHPELIEHATTAFSLPAVPPGAVPDAPPPRPAPVPPGDRADPSSAELPEPVDLDLDGAVLNVGGFLYEPTHLTWDPETSEAIVTGDVSYVQTVTDETPGGVLDSPPTFSFTAGLDSGTNLYSGSVTSLPEIPEEGTVEVEIEFATVFELDPDDLGLYLGPRSAMVASAPLTPGSSVPAYPPAPTEAAIEADPAVARDWTVTLTGYRTGFLQTAHAATPGRIDLEVFFTVTCGPAATDRSSGLAFGPAAQLFLSSPDGYLVGAVHDSGTLAFEPGETKEMSVTFAVPDNFEPGELGFALRSIDERLLPDDFVETTFPALLTGGAAPTGGVGP